jgi:hypothetical protein
VDEAVLLDLARAALEAGASVPRTLGALGEAVGGADGAALTAAGAALLAGGSWRNAWAAGPATAPSLREALEPAWTDGVAPEETLRLAAARLRAERADRARQDAARLGVRLVLPLGLCFLPAFVLLGLVPVVLGSGLGLAGLWGGG